MASALHDGAAGHAHVELVQVDARRPVPSVTRAEGCAVSKRVSWEAGRLPDRHMGPPRLCPRPLPSDPSLAHAPHRTRGPRFHNLRVALRSLHVIAFGVHYPRAWFVGEFLQGGGSGLLRAYVRDDRGVALVHHHPMTRKPSKKKFKLSASEIRELAPGRGACFATDMITVEGRRVRFMYREQPDNEMDSGWRFMAGYESNEYMGNPANHGVYDVNTIANYDPDIVPLLDAPCGSAFERPTGDAFVPVEFRPPDA
jgi:hypothetical protein